jgi:hypothetical protein
MTLPLDAPHHAVKDGVRGQSATAGLRPDSARPWLLSHVYLATPDRLYVYLTTLAVVSGEDGPRGHTTTLVPTCTRA